MNTNNNTSIYSNYKIINNPLIETNYNSILMRMYAIESLESLLVSKEVDQNT